MQRTSTAGLIEIASHEGIVTSRYKDSVGVWTIGIGHTASAGSPNPAQVSGELSIAEIMEIFRKDVARFEARVRRAFTRPLTQAQFDAAVSFDFNTGGILKASWVQKFNAGDTAGAKSNFMLWKKPPEIIPRRRKERDLFFDGKYSSGGFANVYPASSAGTVIWSKGKRVNVASLLDKPVDPREIDPEVTPLPWIDDEKIPTPTPRPKSGGKAAAGGGIFVFVSAAIAYYWDKIETYFTGVF